MKKISYFSYLCTSTVIRQTESVGPPLEKFSGSAPVYYIIGIRYRVFFFQIQIVSAHEKYAIIQIDTLISFFKSHFFAIITSFRERERERG